MTRLLLPLLVVACKPATLAEGRSGVELVFRDAMGAEVAVTTLPHRRSVRRRLLGDQGRQSGAVRYDDGGALVLGTSGRIANTSLSPTLTCDTPLYAMRVSFDPDDGTRLAFGENLLEVVEGGTVGGVWDWDGDVQAGSGTLDGPTLDGCIGEGSVELTWSFEPDDIPTVRRPGPPPTDAQPSSSRSIDF